MQTLRLPILDLGQPSLFFECVWFCNFRVGFVVVLTHTVAICKKNKPEFLRGLLGGVLWGAERDEAMVTVLVAGKGVSYCTGYSQIVTRRHVGGGGGAVSSGG